MTALLLGVAAFLRCWCRPRIMFVGYLAIAVLFLLAMDDLWRRPQRVVRLPARPVAIAVLALWLCVLANALVRLRLQAAASL